MGNAPDHQHLSTDGCPLSACVLLYECCRELGNFSLHNASILCQTLRLKPTAPSSPLLQVLPPESQGYKVWRMAVNRTSKGLPTLNCDWVHLEDVVDRCCSQECRKSICNDASLVSLSFHFFFTPMIPARNCKIIFWEFYLYVWTLDGNLVILFVIPLNDSISSLVPFIYLYSCSVS